MSSFAASSPATATTLLARPGQAQGQGQSTRDSSLSLNAPSSSSTYFTAHERLSNASSNSNSLPFSSTSSSASSELSHDSPFFVPRSPAPNTPPIIPIDNNKPHIQSADSSRPYPLIERRSFRDVSSTGDLIASNLDAVVPPGSGSTSRGRTTPVGAIGDGRKSGPSPSPEKQSFAPSAIGGHPGGLFDGARGALANSLNGYHDLSSSTSTSTSPSRPSSFILDLLPSRSTSQANLSILSTSSDANLEDSAQLGSATSSSVANNSHFVAGLAGITSSTLFHSPTSTGVPALPPTTSNASRASSPAPVESSASAGGNSDYLANRISTLETSVSDLSSLVHNELRSLKEELSVLRGIVLQSQPNMLSNGPPLRGETDSPLLTLRSPSPHHSPAFPARPIQHQHSLSYLNLPSNNPSPSSPSFNNPAPPSPALSAPGGLYQDRAQESKDDQIRALQAQVSALTSSVSQLMSSGAGALGSASVTPLQSPHLGALQQQGGPLRQLSLPPLGSPSLAGTGSPGLGALNDGWKRDGTTGLGVTTPSGPGGARSPLLRPVSANGGTGLNRQSSIGSSGFGRDDSSGAGAGRRGFGAVGQSGLRQDSANFEAGSNWDSASGGMPSPLVGLGTPTLNSNPPGSLGGKWEALGVGNELFRSVAKYGLGPPTKVQCKAIPCILRKEDIVSQAPSIQERIQSYIVPALQMICSSAAQATLEGNTLAGKGVQVIVITATVDQAAQAQRLAVGLGGSLGIRTSLCVGQGDLQQDLQTFLKSPPHVLVGTPQRLCDLLALRTLPLHDVRLLVIDECDQLIARNLSEFVANISRLLPPSNPSGGSAHGQSSPNVGRSPLIGAGQQLPGSFDTTPRFADSPRFPSSSSASSLTVMGTGSVDGRQTIIFSCTVPQDVLTFAQSLQLREPVRVLVRREGGDSSAPSVRGLRQFYMYIAMGSTVKGKSGGALARREASNAREWKLEALADLCEEQAFDTCVIFCSSVDAVEAVSYKLGTRGIEALALHQDMGQSARHTIMGKFRAAPGTRTTPNKRALVVYDALTRSLTDIHQVVPLVINYDLPRAVEDYVHRIACATTSGYGRSGTAINIVTPGADVDMLRSIETFYRCKINELPGNF
ncbi:hypothetical protein T439DRAFT_183927 [Meredithblackwellia eburnea MCA 4105]